MRSACLASAIVAMNWSMIPHGMLANRCSACWQHWALCTGSITACLCVDTLPLASASRNENTATSSEAELERPPPTGTDDVMTASNDGSRSLKHNEHGIMSTARPNKGLRSGIQAMSPPEA